MAKKIEGYVDGEGDGPEFTPYKEGNKYFPFWEAQGITLKPQFNYWRKAVVIVTEERVFTESEVKEMLADIGHHTIAFLSTSEYHSHIINTAKRHGVVFDPA